MSTPTSRRNSIDRGSYRKEPSLDELDGVPETGCLSIVVLGASGDLAKKKTFPALFNLFRQGFLRSNEVHIFGYARTKLTDDGLRERIHGYLTPGKGASSEHSEDLTSFLQLIKYVSGSYDSAEGFLLLNKEILEHESSKDSHPGTSRRLFYLALPPSVYPSVCKMIRNYCMNESDLSGWARVVVEKPFGKDLSSAEELSSQLGQLFDEQQLYRIDHYLGKELVQNLLVLRFANRFFLPLWNRDNIDNIQIVFREDFGTEGRGGYFDEYGIIRDIIQNHLLQVLCLVAMEKPVSLTPEHIRDEKVKVLQSVSPIVSEDVVLGQYEGYRDDPTVPDKSNTPTFATVILRIHNERWEGVPFILKAGKALNSRKAEIRVQFKDVPGKKQGRNEFVIRLQPLEAMYMKLTVKKPGLEMSTIQSELDLSYGQRYQDITIPEAYERLILDTIRGDQQHFVRRDELKAAWEIFTPLLHRIDAGELKPLTYQPGSRGPKAADELLAKAGYVQTHGYIWIPPTLFVELLWQLSVHALREVHRRTFAADVASNPLPASLTDISYLNAAALLPVTKARITLERRKFLKNANLAVHRQTTWSNLAHEMTAEFRGLCAEEAYLQQELEKLQDMRNKAKLEGELWDDRIPSSSSQNSHLVSKATRLWESILARKSQHDVLASGPIEDLIAHRDHRYRISGSSLLAAMDQSSHASHSNVLSVHSGEKSSPLDNREQTDSPQFQVDKETLSLMDDRSRRVHPTVDVAEILRRWTHALQRIHKQSLHLAKANDGEGPELLRCASDSGASGHAESLAATLTEHRQHLVSIEVLINQLKEAVPAMQKSITELTEEVNNISPVVIDKYNERSTTPAQAQSSGRIGDNTDDVIDMTSKLSTHLDKVSTSPALKLPHLFGLTPNSIGKSMQTSKRQAKIQPSQKESLPVVDPSIAIDHTDSAAQDSDSYYAQSLRHSVREAALSRPSINSDWSEEKSSDGGSEHFFMPLSDDVTRTNAGPLNRRKQRLFFSPAESHITKCTSDYSSDTESHLYPTSKSFNESNRLDEYRNKENGFSTAIGMDYDNGVHGTLLYEDTSLGQVFSPPLLIDDSLFTDAYEDLLAPLSETDAAIMEG